jgi:3-dehydroquinate synthase
MNIIKVKASSEYDVIIERGALARAGALTASAISPCTLCIVTDDTVDALYATALDASLTSAGFKTLKFVIPHGEASKSTASLVALLEFMAEHAMTRADAIVALGGGVVGDLAGFAAAVYLRGIKFIQIPTTLLACVDSSVGGKTGVDLAAGKNLAGAFHQPSLVICDPDTLDTLSPEIFADGCAEVIKYAIINDKSLFELIGRGIKENIEDVIAACVKNKADIVAADEFDTGRRQLLNLGHTAAHGIEKVSGYLLTHGEAVAVGTVIATKIAENLGLCEKGTHKEIEKILAKGGKGWYNTHIALHKGSVSLAYSRQSLSRGLRPQGRGAPYRACPLLRGGRLQALSETRKSSAHRIV